jgi:hypothetical protein
MASTTATSYRTARTSPAQMHQLHFLGWYEPLYEEEYETGYAETLSSDNESDTPSTGTETTSEPTLSGSEFETAESQPATTSGDFTTAKEHQTAWAQTATWSDTDPGALLTRMAGLTVPAAEPTHVTYGGLEPDQEAKETRAEVLKRRRQECRADEVDVALAPVLKIQTPYVMYPHQFAEFRKMFPRVTPDPGLAFTHHDHPVAHTATLVGMRRLQSMLQSGEFVLDVNGNPNSNEAFNRFQSSRLTKRPHLPLPPIIATMVKEHSAMDAVRRVTKWGKPKGEFGQERYFEGDLTDITPGMYDTFLMVHTLYYHSMYDINALLSKNRKAKILALVNYSPEQSGKLYGELNFSKSGGVTRQTSPNGENYIHPDIDRWFQSNTFRGQSEQLGCGIAWTSTCIGGPLYVVTITSCEWDLARRHVYDPPSAPTLTVGRGSIYFAWMRIGDSNVQLRISNHELASDLRHFMTFRDRSNPQTLSDLAVKARRITAPDLATGARQYSVNDGELGDHIAYAYCVDAPGELELLEGIKLLRGEVFTKHAEGLKLDGKDNILGVFDSIGITKFFSGRRFDHALGGRKVKDKLGLVEKTTTNSGGLLAVKRT